MEYVLWRCHERFTILFSRSFFSFIIICSQFHVLHMCDEYKYLDLNFDC